MGLSELQTISLVAVLDRWKLNHAVLPFISESNSIKINILQNMPKPYKRKKEPYNNERMQEAVSAVLKGTYFIRKATDIFNVNKSTKQSTKIQVNLEGVQQSLQKLRRKLQTHKKRHQDREWTYRGDNYCTGSVPSAKKRS